jgi:ABC-type multidrug transport system fused ATPase/permease subunit
MAVDDVSTSGLVISYILPLSSMTSGLFYPLMMLANSAVSIQRLLEFVDFNIHEKPFSYPKSQEGWPQSGEIFVHNLSVRYRKGLPLVLEGISFDAKPGTKMAIVGRTGSGKSTTLLCLMRILEMAKNEEGEPTGYISIDGQRINEIGLHELRSKIAIIPQDPYLFEGTLRSNIDPGEFYEDEEIVAALRLVSVLETIRIEDILNQKIKKLKEKQKEKFSKMSKSEKRKIKNQFKTVDNFAKSTIIMDDDPDLARLKQGQITDHDKLYLEVESRGANLSIGQRQLICIARAIIKNPKILLMDEATANIDQRTDAIIQEVIKNRLPDTTVVTIAHRLITIIQYDKLLIFEQGKKIEEGSPLELIENGGYFCELVEEGGEEFKKNMIFAAKNRDVDPASLFS